MRPGQYNNNNNNKNRNRNRNRRPGGGGTGQSGGSGANRVYDSNGPDVKLRGTAQTIAEKYMQLARDAQSSGDTVAAESYFQFADHYYRVWLAAQPAGQPIQFSRRMAEDEFDEDGNEIVAEAENDSQPQEGGENSDNVSAEGGEGQAEGDQQPQQNRQNNRNDRYNNNNQNREGGNNRNFRQRWPRRNDRYNQDGQPNGNQADGQNENGERQVSYERPVEDVVVVQPREAEVQDFNKQDSGNWEAPSFLTRPTPIVASAPEVAAEDVPAPRPRVRKPRAVTPVEDAPQGE
jgi:Domain of unknown function (DUF4167)